MGLCCLHICQEIGNSGEKTPLIDLMEGDSTNSSFVDLSGSDETAEEKDQENQSEAKVNNDQKPDGSQETEVTPEDNDQVYREEEHSQETTEPEKGTFWEDETLETSTGDGYDTPPEDEDEVQQIPNDTSRLEGDAGQNTTAGCEMVEEDNRETQMLSVGFVGLEETTYEVSRDTEEPNKGQSEPHHNTQGDRRGYVESNLKERNEQEVYKKESDAIHTEDTMEDPQEPKKEEHETDREVMYEESLESKDVCEDDKVSVEKRILHGGNQKPGKTKKEESTCEEQSLEPPRLEAKGGDQSETLWTSRIDGAVALRMEESGAAARSPITVSQMFLEVVKKHGQKVALCVRADDGWEQITYSQYEQQSRNLARGFLKLGLERFCAVLILGCNSPEWFMAQIGAMLAGGIAIGIDPSSTASFCLKVALDSRAQIILVDNQKQLRKILQIQEKLPNLKAMIQWKGRETDPRPGLYTWNQLVNLGSELEESDLDEVIEDQEPSQCCAVMYSVEDGGEPRGAMISHDNVTWTSWAMQEMLSLGSEVVVVSYLPLGHMCVQLFDLWLPLSCGGTTYFVESDPQKGSLVSTLCDVHPTLFLGFPRLWEQVHERWMLMEEKATPLQKMSINWARRKGSLSYSSSGSLPWGQNIAEHLVFRPARRALGLDRCILCYVGTEPIGQNVADYFRSLGIPLLEIYGKNETSGVQSIMLPSSWRTSRVELAGCRTRMNQDGLGLCLSGRNVFLGYLGMEQVTRETFTEDGWLITDSQQLQKTSEDPEEVYMEL